MYIKNAFYRAGVVSASALMALSVCAPALTASANHRRPVSHKRTVRKHKLTRRQRRTLRRDNSLIKQINRKINQDEGQLYAMNARALNKNLRKHGYVPEQREAILGVVANQTGFTFQNNSSKHHFGYFGFTDLNARGLTKYAHSHRTNKYNINTQLNYMDHINHRNFNGEDGTPVQLYQSLAKNYLRQGVVASKFHSASLIKRASNKADMHMSRNDIREIQTEREITVAEHHLGMPYSVFSRGKGARLIANGAKVRRDVGTDNSGFVYGALKYAGFKTPRQVFTTMNMSKYLRTVPAKKAKHGDVIYNHEHSAILMQDYKGGNTRIVEEGGAKSHSNISTISRAFGSHASFTVGRPED